jgi:GT2 family glycosyltransferase
VNCLSCGLIYQNPRPTIEEMAAHYPPDYESFAPELDSRDFSWIHRKAFQYGVSKRCHFISRHKRSGRISDVGCATGIFLNGIRNSGNWGTIGVEINEYAADIAKQRGLDVRVGTLKLAGFEDGLFDETWFLYYEDADFCYRVKEAGFRIICYGDTVLYHKASLSTNKNQASNLRIRARNSVWFYRRYPLGLHQWLTTCFLFLIAIYRS